MRRLRCTREWWRAASASASAAAAAARRRRAVASFPPPPPPPPLSPCCPGLLGSAADEDVFNDVRWRVKTTREASDEGWGYKPRGVKVLYVVKNFGTQPSQLLHICSEN